MPRTTTETHCHCGAAFGGSDHCPECHCEQYEATCTWVAGSFIAWIVNDPGSMTEREIVITDAASERQAYRAATAQCGEGEFVRAVFRPV
jgi:hypothetical protein